MYLMNLCEGSIIISPLSALPVFKQAVWEECVHNCLLYSAHLPFHIHPMTDSPRRTGSSWGWQVSCNTTSCHCHGNMASEK